MFLGIEIGGTKLQLGVGRGDGSPFIAFERCDVRSERGAAGILEQIAAIGRPLVEAHGVVRIGFGFGGPIDALAGRVTTSHQVEGWDDFPLIEWCSRELSLPAVLGNDCDSAALAEARFGAGQGAHTVYYVTVGTGVGGGLVIGGQLHGSGRPAVAEIGHLRPRAFAGDEHATVESLSSGRGIASAARNLLAEPTVSQQDRKDLLDRARANLDRLTAKDVAQAAVSGNHAAESVFRQATATLGWAIAQMVTLVAPDVVVVGGGVSLAGEELFYRPVREAVRRYVFPPLAVSYQIVPPKLGETVVVQGALALAAGGL